jgi:CheY-like chemotaxis protein
MKKINCILLIDDNPADNAYHKIVIEEAEACNCILIYTKAADALDYIINVKTSSLEDNPKPDLIFLDINMPGMNGFEFLEKYNSLAADVKSKIMIVMLTTSVNPDDRKRALDNADVTQFYIKPLTVEGVQEIVNNYFQ